MMNYEIPFNNYEIPFNEAKKDSNGYAMLLVKFGD